MGLQRARIMKTVASMASAVFFDGCIASSYTGLFVIKVKKIILQAVTGNDGKESSV